MGNMEPLDLSRMTYFQAKGLCAKVLYDRVDEMTSGALYRGKNIVCLPRNGGCAEWLSVYLGGSAALGAGSPVIPGSLPVQHLVLKQTLREVATKLKHKARTRNWSELETILSNKGRCFSVVENIMCCSMKPVHSLIGHCSHATY